MTEQPNAAIVFIGLGSNLADPEDQINRARIAINQLKLSSEIAFSSLYNSPPMGPKNQPDYTNAVMQISTSLQSMVLLRALQTIENMQGRERKPGQRWGARTLDLDLLLYNQEQIKLPDLIVPHIGLADRSFVLYPLQEIAPELMIPELGRLSNLVAHCPLNGLKKK